jgi:[CysO sulfur-carrier protein]-S-L-cysteine hydrolase
VYKFYVMISELKISRHDIEIIQAELEANKPYEACGVLIGTINGNAALVEKALPVTNSKRTRRSFELDPKEHYDAWNEAEKSGKEIVGIYHTHPVSSAVPSLWDRETMENAPSVWLIAGVDGMRAYVWEKGVRAVKITEY